MTLQRMQLRTIIPSGGKLQTKTIHYLTYKILFFRFGTSQRGRHGRQMSLNWPGPGDTDVPSYTKGEGKSHTRKPTIFTTQEIELDEKKLKAIRDKIYQKGDGLGPDQYTLPKFPAGPLFSFGSRFSSSVRNIDHLRPRKVEGPGPGSYKLPSSVQIKTRHPASVHRTTFGTSLREFNDLPQENPGPDRYRKEKFTEASHMYSFSQDYPRIKNSKEIKEANLPGPTHYKTVN